LLSIVPEMKRLILAITVGCIAFVPVALNAVDSKAPASASCCEQAKTGCSDAKSTCSMSAKETKAAQKAAKKAQKKAAKQAAKEAAAKDTAKAQN